MNLKLSKSKNVFLILLLVILVQSCKIYDTDSVPEFEAVSSAKKVKVITVDGKTYKFNKLVIDEDNLVGLTKPQSKEAKLLPSEKFVDSTGHKLEKVSIDRDTIKEINVFDKKTSRTRTIILVVGITLGALILLSVAAAAVVVTAW